MRSGSRRHAVRFERPVESVATSGANDTKFRKAFDTLASIVPLSGRELFAAQQVQAEVTTRINIRWRAGVEETMRILDLSEKTYFDILAVLPDKTGRREIDCLCIRRTSEGWRRGK